MPPRKKAKTRAATPSEDSEPKRVLPMEVDHNSSLLQLSGTFDESVDLLVDRVRKAVFKNVTMFKIEVASIVAGMEAADVIADLSAKAHQDICEIVPLCQVRLNDLPPNGCAMLFDQRQYAEALVHAVRAHFAFVAFDRRLIYTSTAGPSDRGTPRLLYLFTYLRTAADRAEPAATNTAAARLGMRDANNRRGTVAVPSSVSIESELEQFREELDRAEQELMDASRSMEDDYRLPEPSPPLVSLSVPRRSLGPALPAVLPTAAPRGGRFGGRRKRPSSPEPAPAAAGSGTPPPPLPPAVTPSKAKSARPAMTPRKVNTAPPVVVPSNAKSSPKTGALPAREAHQLAAFFARLSGAQSEQSRVSLTCRYAKLRYGHDVSSGTVYRLAESLPGPAAPPPPPPPPLSENEQRETALAVYSELDAIHSEQSRVAYTLQYMRVQHSARIGANALFGWLGQAANKVKAKPKTQ